MLAPLVQLINQVRRGLPRPFVRPSAAPLLRRIRTARPEEAAWRGHLRARGPCRGERELEARSGLSADLMPGPSWTWIPKIYPQGCINTSSDDGCMGRDRGDLL